LAWPIVTKGVRTKCHRTKCHGQNATNSGICFIFFKISAKFYSKYKTPTHFL